MHDAKKTQLLKAPKETLTMEQQVRAALDNEGEALLNTDHVGESILEMDYGVILTLTIHDKMPVGHMRALPIVLGDAFRDLDFLVKIRIQDSDGRELIPELNLLSNK